MVLCKYIICPGEVRSKSDGDIHYISGQELIRLYRLDPRECYILDYDRPLAVDLAGLPTLGPRYHGDYMVGR